MDGAASVPNRKRTISSSRWRARERRECSAEAMGLPLLQPRRPSPRLEQARRSFAGGVRFPPVSFVCSLFFSFSRFGTLDQACHAADVLLIYHWLCCDGHHNKDDMRLYVRIRTGIVRFGLRTDRRRLSTHLNAQVPPAALSRSTAEI